MERGNVISREDFLKFHVVAFPKYEEVTVPGLGTVWVKKLNAGERDRFELGDLGSRKTDFRAKLVAFCCINEQGAALFDENDIPSLTLFDPDILDPIVMAALRVNNFTKAEQEELQKNLNGQAAPSIAG